MEQLDIHLLSDFRILHNGVLLTKISAERLQSLLAYLLLHRQAPQPRHHIAFVLWPDSSEAQARTNLRNLLHSLRQTLPAADRFIATDNLTTPAICCPATMMIGSSLYATNCANVSATPSLL